MCKVLIHYNVRKTLQRKRKIYPSNRIVNVYTNRTAQFYDVLRFVFFIHTHFMYFLAIIFNQYLNGLFTAYIYINTRTYKTNTIQLPTSNTLGTQIEFTPSCTYHTCHVDITVIPIYFRGKKIIRLY